ncbi:MAG: cyclically-permuted mutarotase family protein [Muribaculaceae bacterium]|nr:cyclically-permuted mutarotase family protein [Muribaculaceae bacterium]
MGRRIRKTILWAAAALAAAPAVCAATTDRVKVACIGNSITYGDRLPDRDTQSYPARLQQMLGSDFEVGNFGRNGATLLRNGHNPWHKTAEAARAFEFAPDIAVIHLGTNDTDPRDWPHWSDSFSTDYCWLIDTLRTINPNVRIIVANMAPIGTAHRRFKSGTRQWRDLIRERIAGVARHTGVELIDFAEPLDGRPELLPDNLHPVPEGTVLMADYVRGAITGRWGGLALPPVYGDSMVLPRDRFLKLGGRADSGAEVTVTLAGATSSARADNLGRWQVTLPPLKAGGPYEMTVTDGHTTLRFADVMAGEVWIASGQSNMEFQLDWSDDAPADPAGNPLLRVFRMSDRVRPAAGQWPDSVLAAVDTLDYYLPAKWAVPDGRFSAVAWHFGAMLADSLQVPVGIISNPVGGAGTESFIDIETLRHGLPEILLDWLGNHYVQPWVQERAAENIGGRQSGHRHPYEPSYLFHAGIRPLGAYPVSGVIWYQGESNAHNAEVHETLFPLLVSSWRKEFGRPDLPFLTSQLSSLGRPSWPAFRDSQRRLAENIPGVGMAVTHDVGDPHDVHPKRKAPVGRRLARLALHDVYGMDHVAARGPHPVKAEALPGEIRLIMADAGGMTTSDGSSPLTFEIAETEGFYLPASATIKSDTILLTNPDMKNPRFARYGWQPFTKANLVNSDSLPASTFRVEANVTERGLEHGVSAAFGGSVGDVPVIAGGCNFPYDDPLAPGIEKVYYKGIYRATDGKRIGELPQPTAYGASAATPLGLAMIGGEGLRSAWLLTLDADSMAVLEPLPDLPVAVDNAYAAAVGTKIFVAGGNADGKPWRGLLSLDLADIPAGWTRLADMPGNPRVQPVMAAAPDGRLYLWGGFAPRHEGYDSPTLQCDGIRYDPASDSWSMLPTPTVGRTKISLGGGVAECIGGKIVCTGGVNREVFLNALRSQPDDYLSHPKEWYRFNGRVCVFDPQTDRWVIGNREPDYARAGAATAVIDGGRTMLLMGGELKPRIRTPRFTPVKPK